MRFRRTRTREPEPSPLDIVFDGTFGLYGVEFSVLSDAFKLKLADAVADAAMASVHRAVSFSHAKADLGLAPDRYASEIYREMNDFLGIRVEAEFGLAFFVGYCPAPCKAPLSPAPLILGDMSVQGSTKHLQSLTEPLQVAKDNSPTENERNFLGRSADNTEHVGPRFWGELKTAAMKVQGG